MQNNGTRPRRNLLLIGSLAVNLLVVCLVLGAMLGGHRDPDRYRDRDRNPALRDLGLGPFVSALPQDEREILNEAMRHNADAFRVNRREMRDMFDAFLAGLRAEPFDAVALRRTVEDQQAKVTERQSLGRDLLWDRIEAMDAAARAAYADALQKSLRRGPSHGKWRDSRD